MAKKAARGERSQAIRDYLAVHPEQGPTEVVAGLSAQGITVKPGLVSAIKYKKVPGTPGKSRRGRKPGRKAGANGSGGMNIGSLLAAKEFVDAVGGIAEAKKALETLEQLR